ncbi:MAG: hypothetical protein ACRD3B_19940 [Candidatus Sulfotelmatobacter sp.]
MKIAIISAALLVGLIAPELSRSQSSASISISFVVDGRPEPCEAFRVELTLDGQIIKPKQKGQHFEVPRLFQRPRSEWHNGQYVEISLACNGRTFIFPENSPAFVQAGDWELGIARPPYSIETFRRTRELEQGAWWSYLVFQGEPGVITFVSQPDVPTDIAEALRKEQPNAAGARGRDIAYALAVYGVEYEDNRDRLMLLLYDCLSKPKESPENEECDGTLLDFVTNLYWRGDDALLLPLLRMADSRGDVIGEIGTFYSDLLDRRGQVILHNIASLSVDKQQLICKLADEDDLSYDSPKRDRIKTLLKRTGSESAVRCLASLVN